MTVDGTAAQLTVRASPGFLQGLVEWCDGTNGLADLQLLAASRWGPSGFMEFVSAMTESGVLQQERRREFDPACRIEWAAELGAGAPRVARASSPNEPGVVAWGRAYDAHTAKRKAYCEFAERRAQRAPAVGVSACAKPDGQWVDPLRLARYSPDQYANRALGVRAFDGSPSQLWLRGKEWFSGGEAWLPAECVYGRAALGCHTGQPWLMRLTSSGCAAETSLSTAVERAAYELIERDALARHWLAQRAAKRIRAESLPGLIRLRIEVLASLGCEVHILCMKGILGPAILALVRNEARGFVTVGSAVDSEIEQAVERAFIEAEFAALARCNGAAAPKVRPRAARRPEDHAHLFARRGHFRRADVLIGPAREAVDLPAIAWPTSLSERMQSHQNRPLYWLPLGAGEIPLHLDGKPLLVVRALIPGCIPIAFGFDALPRGMVAHRVSRRGRFPHPLC